MVDASALVAMATREPDAEPLARELRRYRDRLCPSVGLWEAARAVSRKRKVSAAFALEELRFLLADLAIHVVGIGEAEARIALQVHDRYGKGNHPAQLNMGDCFAYSCAKANNARLLYKGDDFAKTDLA